MAIPCFVKIVVHDAQEREGSFEWRVPDADWGATTLPTKSEVTAVVDALFGDAKLSNAQVKYVEAYIKDETYAGGGGGGTSQISARLRTRSNKPTDPFKLPIEGLNQSAVVFGDSDRNEVSTTGPLWTALRAALTAASVAISAPDGAYAAVASGNLFQSATAFDGRRGLLRPK